MLTAAAEAVDPSRADGGAVPPCEARGRRGAGRCRYGTPVVCGGHHHVRGAPGLRTRVRHGPARRERCGPCAGSCRTKRPSTCTCRAALLLPGELRCGKPRWCPPPNLAHTLVPLSVRTVAGTDAIHNAVFVSPTLEAAQRLTRKLCPELLPRAGAKSRELLTTWCVTPPHACRWAFPRPRRNGFLLFHAATCAGRTPMLTSWHAVRRHHGRWCVAPRSVAAPTRPVQEERSRLSRRRRAWCLARRWWLS